MDWKDIKQGIRTDLNLVILKLSNCYLLQSYLDLSRVGIPSWNFKNLCSNLLTIPDFLHCWDLTSQHNIKNKTKQKIKSMTKCSPLFLTSHKAFCMMRISILIRGDEKHQPGIVSDCWAMISSRNLTNFSHHLDCRFAPSDIHKPSYGSFTQDTLINCSDTTNWSHIITETTSFWSPHVWPS